MDRLGPLKLHEKVDEYSRELFSVLTYSKISLSNELKSIKKVRSRYLYMELLSHARRAVENGMAIRAEFGLANLRSELILFKNVVYGLRVEGPQVAYGVDAAKILRENMPESVDLAVYEFDKSILPFEVGEEPAAPAKPSQVESTLVKVHDIVYRMALHHVIKVIDVESKVEDGLIVLRVVVRRGRGFLWGRTKSRFIRDVEEAVLSRVGVKAKVEIVEMR